MIQFAREPLTDDLWAEAMPLLEAHWREVAHYQDIPLNVDRAVYDASDAAGAVRVYTARELRTTTKVYGDPMNPYGLTTTVSGVLVGYALFFVRPHPHYAGSLQAAQDVIYLDPTCRGGNGLRFMQFCEQMLANEGVQVVSQHLKIAHKHDRTMLALGYVPMDTIWVKRLDGVRSEPTEEQKATFVAELKTEIRRRMAGV